MEKPIADEELVLRVTVLHDVSLLLNCAEEYSELLFGLVRHFSVLSPVEYAALLINDNGVFRMAAAVNGNDENSYQLPKPVNIPAIPVPADVSSNDFFTETVPVGDENRGDLPEKITSLLLSPLFRGKEVSGMLVFGLSGERFFCKQDQALIFQISLQMAAVLKNFLLRDELRAMNRQLELIFSNTEEGFLLLDEDFIVITCNAPVKERFFIDNPPLAGDNFPEYILRNRRQFRMGQWMHYLKVLQENPAEKLPLLIDLHREGDNPVNLIRVEFQSLQNNNYKPRMLVVLRDRSETLRADALKKDLTMMLVHDLRSPLGIINWNLEMILDGVGGDVTPKQQKILQGSIRNSQELLDMIDSLLDIDRLETGSLDLELNDIDCSGLINDLAGRMEFLAEQMEISVCSKPADDLPPIKADKSLLRRILFNLVFNGAKYSPPGSSVTVGAERSDKSILFYVQDQGPGIPEKYRQIIFDKYIQAEARSRGEIKSKGLGLTFCKLAVEAHNGNIWVETAPGGGSLFKFKLPLKPSKTGS